MEANLILFDLSGGPKRRLWAFDRYDVAELHRLERRYEKALRFLREVSG